MFRAISSRHVPKLESSLQFIFRTTSHRSTFSAWPTSRTSAIQVQQRSVWDSIIPKFIRRRAQNNREEHVRTSNTEWNPATFFIVIFLVIGSNAIQMIALRNSNQSFTRKNEARIALLRELIERLQTGEKVDVEKFLGTGDGALENEWDTVMQELRSIDENLLQEPQGFTKEKCQDSEGHTQVKDRIQKPSDGETSVGETAEALRNLETRFL